MKVLYQIFLDWVIIREARIVMRSLRLRRTKDFQQATVGIYFIFAKKSFFNLRFSNSDRDGFMSSILCQNVKTDLA
jgi:hypothetical protein